jgi:hypothetical protein
MMSSRFNVGEVKFAAFLYIIKTKDFAVSHENY